jgi:hypothetical protein
MSPDLVKLAEKNAKKLQVLMLSRGDVGRTSARRRPSATRSPVVLQKSWEISKLYGMSRRRSAT